MSKSLSAFVAMAVVMCSGIAVQTALVENRQVQPLDTIFMYKRLT